MPCLYALAAALGVWARVASEAEILCQSYKSLVVDNSVLPIETLGLLIMTNYWK